MEYKKHCKRSMELYGEEANHIHKWLDQYSKEFGWSHRIILHNREGIEIGVLLFGERYRKHLELHIMDDYMYGNVIDIPYIKDIKEDPEAYGFLGNCILFK